MISYYSVGMGDDTLMKIETLIGKYRQFAESNPGVDEYWLREFGSWLQRGGTTEQTGEHAGLGENDTMIGMFLVSLNNLTRSRLNKLVKSTPFANIMDYHFLLLLDGHGQQRKSDLIASNHMEMSSGIEVIRRLLKHGWIREEPNPQDRRSKYVSISPKGKQLIEKMQVQVDEFYRSFCAALDDRQKVDVLQSLELLLTRI